MTERVGVVTVRVTTRQPHWRELVQDRKELWVFRDCPDMLKLAPGVARELQELERRAPPVVGSVMVTGMTQPPQPLMEVQLDINGGRASSYGVLAWEEEGRQWLYWDAQGEGSPWATAVASTLGARRVDSLPRPQHFSQ